MINQKLTDFGNPPTYLVCSDTALASASNDFSGLRPRLASPRKIRPLGAGFDGAPSPCITGARRAHCVAVKPIGPRRDPPPP